MNITTKTITTRVHSASFSADEIKAVALLTAKSKVGVADANVVSSEADVAADGSITVEIVEAVPAGGDTGTNRPPNDAEGLKPGFQIA